MSAYGEDRPTFMERVGIAANARDLTVGEQRGPVDTMIGLGMALASLKRNPGKHPLLVEIERELVPALWKLKAGEQGIYAHRAVSLFTSWMIEKRRFPVEHRPLVETFALRAIYEWLHETCQRCDGAGLLERVGHGMVKPRGLMAKNASMATCTLCHGSRRALAKHGERAQVLDIPMKWYESEGWVRRFNLALISLDAIARRLNRPLALRFRQE